MWRIKEPFDESEREEWKSWLKLNIQKTKIIASSPITSCQIDGETMEMVTDFIWGAPKSLQTVIAAMKLKDTCSWKKSYDQPRQHTKKQRHCFANKDSSTQRYGFSNSYVGMWELDYKESWVLKNWCFWTVVLEKTLESPLGCKEIQPVHPKGDQSWVFIGKTDAKAETPILWPPDANNSYWKRLWCWEWLKAGGEGDDRGWDSWMASPIQWTWIWSSPERWWWTGKPGMRQFMA